MAKIKDIIAREDSSKQVIKLYKEGIFYKAYEYSAYLFTKHIKAYQVKRKYSVQLKRDLVSIGFPITSFSALAIPETCRLQEFPHHLELEVSDEPLDTSAYVEWKDGISLSVQEPKVNVQNRGGNGFTISTLEYDVLQRLHRFNIDTATPMACMLLLSELKQSLSLISSNNEL